MEVHFGLPYASIKQVRRVVFKVSKSIDLWRWIFGAIILQLQSIKGGRGDPSSLTYGSFGLKKTL